MERNLRKTRTGKVISDKMDKTIVVAIEEHVKHPLYKKIVKDTDHLLVFTYFNKVKKLSKDVESIGHFDQGDRPIEVLNIKME